MTTRDRAGKPLLPSASLLKYAAKAQLPLIVEYYWLRVINLASMARSPDDGRDVLGMSELIEELDPDFSQVYWFAALNGVIPMSSTVWANAEEGAEHLRRGLRRFPDEHRMTICLAYALWRYQGKLAEAAEVLRAAAARPKAPSYFIPLATRLLVAAGEFRTSREFTREFLENGTLDPRTRRILENREHAIDLEERLVLIETAAKRYLDEKGRPAASVDELVYTGYLPDVPTDPYGGSLLLAPDGTAYSSANPERLKLHE
ncbi:MAG: hypothetical protein IPJ65_17670 [Archangiaceae bacterium]|nr:hypothetical protein [Archangiaceae bacterium]